MYIHKADSLKIKSLKNQLIFLSSLNISLIKLEIVFIFRID